MMNVILSSVKNLSRYIIPYEVRGEYPSGEIDTYISLTSGYYLFEVSADRKLSLAVFLTDGSKLDQYDFSFTKSGESKRVVKVCGDATLSLMLNDCEVAGLVVSVKYLPAFRADQLIRKKIDRHKRKEVKSDTVKPLSDAYEVYQQCFESCSNEYSKWIHEYEGCLNIEPPQLGPYISIIMPVFNPKLAFLKSAIESILAQTYKNWELCIADDLSESEDIKDYLQCISSEYANINVVFRSSNGHISEATNSAIELATGDYLAFMDQDDLIPVYSLSQISAELISSPNCELLYTDEDKIDDYDKRYDPHFKGGFNLQLLLGQNYMNHFLVVKSELVNQVGGLRKGFEGAQDHDLILRCVDEIKDLNCIVHIPKVLYHWRAHEGSTALYVDQKEYTANSGVKAVSDYLYRNSLSGYVEEGSQPNTYRINRTMSFHPSVEIIILTRDKVELLRSCINSILRKTEYTNYVITIVDNGSSEQETLDYLNNIQGSKIKVLRDSSSFNFSKLNNFAVNESKADYILLMNNDVEVLSKNWLEEMVSIGQLETTGCVGAKLYYSDGSIQHAGVTLGIGGVAGHTHKHFSGDAGGYFSKLHLLQECSAVTAACMLVKRSIYEDVGGMDVSNLAIAFNDVDFCLKVRAAGYKNIWTPSAELYHHESASRGYEDTPEKKKRFSKEVMYMKQKWGSVLSQDPYYNPNLTLDHEDFSLRW